MPEVKATPMAVLVPNPHAGKPGQNYWVPGLALVWAERDLDRPHRWIYCHTDRPDASWTGYRFQSSETFRTKAEALIAGMRWIKLTRHACECPDVPFLAQPGPFTFKKVIP